MEKRRLELHEILCDLLGTRNVYFQPPESVRMKYPAIVYARDDIQKTHANDGTYLTKLRFSVTAIDSDPDSIVTERLLELPLCRFNRQYLSDNLYHNVFELYY